LLEDFWAFDVDGKGAATSFFFSHLLLCFSPFLFLQYFSFSSSFLAADFLAAPAAAFFGGDGKGLTAEQRLCTG
jgi:hypothetical protein